MSINKSKSDIINRIKIQSQHMKADVPPHAWSRIEEKLDNNYAKRRFSYLRLFSYAALTGTAIFFLVLIGIYNKEGKISKTYNEQELYAMNISSINSSTHSYPIYDVHKLRNAYLQLITRQPVPVYKEIIPRLD